MASPAENPEAAWGEASRHTCKTLPVYCGLDRPNYFSPAGHHAGDRWPHAAHHLISRFTSNIPQYEV